MAPSPLSNILYMPDRRPKPTLGALAIALPPDGPQSTRENGAVKTELGDGRVLINLRPDAMTGAKRSDKFDANLALEIDDYKLNSIADELLRGIEQDDQSRNEWLETHAEGIKLLGLIIEDSRGDIGTTSAPLEGMSRYYHPLLLEAVLLFQANARGELLPAAGPVKVRDDQTERQKQAEQMQPPVPPPAPMPPPQPGIGHNGGPPLNAPPAQPPGLPPAAAGVNGGAPVAHPPGAPPVPPPNPGTQPLPLPPGMTVPPPVQPKAPDRTILANALEKDFNHFLTTTACEYYADTDRMCFGIGFGGQGIKKVYNCPLRRRPVSESIPIEDFIVSNALTDLGNAQRMTHRSKMKPSTLRRLQIMGVYRDVHLGQPTQSDQPNAVEQVKAEVMGTQVALQDPKDADHIILECYCELELDEYAPRQFKGKGLRLPYRVTMEKDSRKVLEIRRNWKESDKQCMPREFFVDFSYVKAFGFYGIGLLHILGNTTKAITAICREGIDAGMFANFPGFIYAKGAGRQLTNQFRVGPGQGIGLDIGLQRLQDAVMPLPYKEMSPGFVAFEQHLEQLGQRLGGTANIQVGEGKQDAPVGTTLALIEQATKPTGAVMKRLMAAQGKEFQLLKERFKDDPEAFWRFNRDPAMDWQKEQFIAALDDFDLVPVADPNNPTGLHRRAKGMVKQQLAQLAPGLFDLRKTAISIGEDYETDIEDLLAPPQPPGPPPAPPVDPAKMAQVNATIHGKELDAQSKQQQSELDLQKFKLEMQDRDAERASRLQVAQINENTERLRLAATLSIHADKTDAAERALTMKIGSEHIASAYDQAHQQAMQAQDQLHATQTQARDHLHDVLTQPPQAEPQEEGQQ